MGCHALLQGIFLTQGWNPGLLHCRQSLYRLSRQYHFAKETGRRYCYHIVHLMQEETQAGLGPRWAVSGPASRLGPLPGPPEPCVAWWAPCPAQEPPPRHGGQGRAELPDLQQRLDASVLNGSTRSSKGGDVQLGALWPCVQAPEGFLLEPAAQRD